MRHLTDHDVSTLANACIVAAERYDEHAQQFEKMIDVTPNPKALVQVHGESARRLVEQFQHQAREVRAMADALQQAEEVVIHTERDDRPR